MLWLAAATLLIYLALAVEVVRGNRSIGHLKDVPPLDPAGAPAVTVVIPARDEARGIEAALRSVLAQDYPGLEILVVDDRSTDGTGAILDRMAVEDPRLRVVHITGLPPGWLGKNNALQHGAGQARGEILLFADADVVMHPTTVRRAVAYLLERGLDHLTLTPRIRMSSLLLELFIGTFSIQFALYLRPWRAKDPKSDRFVGIGAFNMVRAAVYRAAGMHGPIAMRPDDDIRLGQLLKKKGFRQDILFGSPLVEVEWYSSLGELVRGLEKNAFAGVDYRVSMVVLATLANLVLSIWPFLGIFLTEGPARWLNLAVMGVFVLLCWSNAPLAHVPRWHGLTYPAGVLLFLYILWRATLITLRQGGIRWRGTLYPLAELKANKL